MNQRCQQSRHYLGARIALGIAVALSVDDKGEALALGNTDAGFHAIRLPQDVAAERLQEVADLVRCALLRLQQTQLTMTPGGGRAGGKDPRHNDHGADKNGGKGAQRFAEAACSNDCGQESADNEQ